MTNEEALALIAKLSRGERAVYDLTVQGLTAKEVGAQLQLSPKTVENHRYSIAKKTGISSIPRLIVWHYCTLLPALETTSKELEKP